MADALKPHTALRDPTVHELHNGPGKEKLPEAVKKMKKAETVCGFCGVSYLVFSEVKELEKRLKDTEDKLKLVKGKAAQYDELKAKVNKMCSAAEKQQEDVKKKEEDWQAEREAAKNEADSLTIRIGSLEAKKRRQEAMLERCKRKLPVVHQFLQLERDTLKEVQSEVDDAQRDIKGMAEQIVERIKSESKRMKGASDTSAALEARLATQAKILTSVEQALQAQKEECAKLEASLTKSKVVAEQDVEKVRGECADEIGRLIKEHNAELERLQLQHSQDKQMFQEQGGKLQLELDTLKEGASNKELTISGLEGQLAASQAETKDLKTKWDEEKQECSKLQKETSRLEEELKQAKDQLATFRASVLDASSDAAGLREQATKLNSELLGERARSMSLLGENRVLKEKLGQLQRDSGSSVQQLQEDVRALREAAEKRSQEREQHDAEQLSSASKAQKAQKDALLNLHQDHVEEIRSKDRKIRDLEAEINRIGTERSSERDSSKRAEAEIQELESQIQHMHDETNQLRMKASDSDSLSVTVNDLNRRLDQVHEEKQQLHRQLEEMQIELARTAGAKNEEGMNAGLEQLEQMMISLSSKVKQKDREIAALQRTVHHECSERTTLLDELERWRGGGGQIPMPPAGNNSSNSNNNGGGGGGGGAEASAVSVSDASWSKGRGRQQGARRGRGKKFR